jgi:hypothetical protein
MEDLSNIEKILVLREEDGNVGLRIGLIFTGYFRGGYQLPVRQAVLEAMAQWLALVSGHVTWAQNPKTENWRRFQPEMPTALAQWLIAKPSDEGWTLALHGGERNIDASAIFFRALGSPDWAPKKLNHVTCGLPLTWFADHPGRFPEFCKKLCAILRPLSGYGGIGFATANGDMLATRFEAATLQIAQHFPGIEVDEPVVHALDIGDDIKGVNWITVLGEALVARFGGRDKLAAALAPPAGLLPYEGGMIVQSGPRPMLGDAAAGRTPRDYVAVNRALKALRAPDARAFHHAGAGRFGREESLAWLARFDD